MSIHIKNSNLHNSPVTEGISNTVIVNFQDSGGIIDWEMLQDHLIETAAQLPKSSEEYYAVKKALKYAGEENKKEFENTINSNLLSFTSGLF